MKLVVDIGNTRIKWAQARGRALSDPRAAVRAGKSLAQVLQAEWQGMPVPQQVLVSNVAGPSAAGDLRRYCEERFHLAPEFLVPARSACGIVSGYRDPAQLGADRWAGVIAACVNHGRPVCVIACGTAITVDTVTQSGEHLGGLIAPGLGLMQTALAAAAPALSVEPGDEIALYARDTRTAVTSGVLYAAAGFVERALDKIRNDQGDVLQVLLTGGDAERLLPQLHGAFTLVPHLVLEGLAVLADEAT